MVDLDEETIKKILVYRDLKSTKIGNAEYLDKIIKEIEDTIAIYEYKIKKYTAYINKSNLTQLDDEQLCILKKCHKKRYRKKNKKN